MCENICNKSVIKVMLCNLVVTYNVVYLIAKPHDFVYSTLFIYHDMIAYTYI